jgi:hypothetical protein
MTPDTLRTVGRALFGARWQTDLSLALGINARTIRSWLSGRNVIPEGVQDELRRIVKDRMAELPDVLAMLE